MSEFMSICRESDRMGDSSILTFCCICLKKMILYDGRKVGQYL